MVSLSDLHHCLNCVIIETVWLIVNISLVDFGYPLPKSSYNLQGSNHELSFLVEKCIHYNIINSVYTYNL